MSTAIIDGVVGPDQFSIQKLADPKVHALIEKVTIDQDPELEKVRGATRVEIWTKQGKKYSQMLQFKNGRYKDPFTDQDIEDKFRLCTSKFLSEEEIREIVDTVYRLEKIADVRELMERLVI